MSRNFTFGDSADDKLFVAILFNWLQIVTGLKSSCCVDVERCGPNAVPSNDTLVVVAVERIGGRGGILFVLLLDDALHPLSINVALPFGKCCWFNWCSLLCLASKNKLKHCLNNFG